MNFPSQSPVVVQNGSFEVVRRLDRGSQLEADTGDLVAPDTAIARTETMEKSFTIYLANELAVPNDSLRKHLAKSVGSTIAEGEPLARVRRGLRTAAVRSPATGTLVHVDDNEGTVTLTASTGPRETMALVHGVVESVNAGQQVRIRAEGSRVYGIVGFGGEAHGPLLVGSDRNDRELTVEQVSEEWRGAIILGGMTIGVPALRKLKEAGVAGVIVGSVSEADIRRFNAPDGEVDVRTFWASHNGLPDGRGSGLVIVATEGFGRLPMANAVYEFLASNAGNDVSVDTTTNTGQHLSRPEIHIAGPGASEDFPAASLDQSRSVRVSDTHRLGTSGTIVSDMEIRTSRSGVRRTGVTVEFESGSQEFIPVENIEVLV